jgi:RES domain-containing protein
VDFVLLRTRVRRIDTCRQATTRSYEVTLQDVVDLREPDARRAVGLSSTDLVSDQLEACQRVGFAAHSVGREGILAPSAAGSGTVLALFPAHLQPGSMIVPTRMETWESPPGQVGSLSNDRHR